MRIKKSSVIPQLTQWERVVSIESTENSVTKEKMQSFLIKKTARPPVLKYETHVDHEVQYFRLQVF